MPVYIIIHEKTFGKDKTSFLGVQDEFTMQIWVGSRLYFTFHKHGFHNGSLSTNVSIRGVRRSDYDFTYRLYILHFLNGRLNKKLSYYCWINNLFDTSHLNCPCHLYGSIYRIHNWAPHCLVYSKVYVVMESLFLFLILSLRSVRQK